MAEFYARSANSLGQKETVSHHLNRTGKLCGQFLSGIGYEDWGQIMGQLHDFGKLSDMFQQVLDNKKTHVNHAIPGAVIAKSLGSKLVVSAIAGHHSELQNAACTTDVLQKSLAGIGERLDEENYELSLFGPQEYRRALAAWGKQFKLRQLSPAPAFSSSEDRQLAKMLFARFLFSALVDADWSSSAEHFEPNYLAEHSGAALDAEAALDALLAIRRKKQQTSTAAASLNNLRNQLFDTCLRAGSQEPGLFTLTAPTGLGKTLSLMAFALQHCKQWKKRRIILMLPYLSILEQNSRDYREILPELLEIHSQVNWTESTRQLAERWDAPCIITTNVSFLEPLFSAQPRDCRHLHQLANSVIILDEAQTLPADLLDATLRTVKELCERYGCTVIFSTATQPSFQHRPGLAWNPREIAPNPANLFNKTQRVRWDWTLDEEIPLEQIAQEVAAYPQCCVIVNLKKHARTLLAALRQQYPEEALFYLTTDLCPAHRTAVLEKIRQRLACKRPCILVATQCIEAGVDLDFPVVYRALAPLDSLIQAAGRCNRNGDGPDGYVRIFIPDVEGRCYPTTEYERAALCVRTLLSRHPIDCSNLEHIEEYYKLLYTCGSGDKQALQDAIRCEDYQEVERQYRIIDQSGVQVIVPYPEQMHLFHTLREQLDREGLTAALLRRAKPLTVASFDRKNVKQYCQALSFHSREQDDTIPTDIYLLGNPAFYDEKQGLNFDNPFDGIF